MVTHNWWHLALFAIDLGQTDLALTLFDQQVWGVAKAYSQDQIGAVSLLARLELADVDVGDRWQDVADHLALRLDDQVLPFLDLQYLYGLARADRPEADVLLRNIEAHGHRMATNGADDSTRMWQRVATPAAQGLVAYARGQYQQALDGLGQALPRLLGIGGSHAQRDLFAQIHLAALMRSGRWGAAQQLVQQHCNGQPESVRLKSHARRVYSMLGIDTRG